MPVLVEIEKRHDESVRRIQDWNKQPTIAAENKGINEGRDLMMRVLKEAVKEDSHVNQSDYSR
jgi:hypothetical protein